MAVFAIILPWMASYGHETSFLLIFSARDDLVKVSCKSDARKCQNQVTLLTLTSWVKGTSPFVEFHSKKNPTHPSLLLPKKLRNLGCPLCRLPEKMTGKFEKMDPNGLKMTKKKCCWSKINEYTPPPLQIKFLAKSRFGDFREEPHPVCGFGWIWDILGPAAE